MREFEKNKKKRTTSGANREYWTLTAWVRTWADGILDPLSRLLTKLGVQPNLLSVIGFFTASAAGAVIAAGHISYGGWLFLFSGPFDALDGSLARTAGLESRFGAFLDSFIDRYSEAVVLFGILCWATFNDRRIIVLVTFLTMVGSLMVSYARARAEGLGISCKVGLFTRLERFIVLTLALLTKQLLVGLIILALLTNFTALQRMFHIYRQSLDQ
ncbi:MAG: CDP-alcohol phosphatidyltransferase family protein [Deltaproteobacteria bacterium]|nr:CDP-alcohol phosphatidyltransferase family protein [Deltaproteobacteria bacterium]